MNNTKMIKNTTAQRVNPPKTPSTSSTPFRRDVGVYVDLSPDVWVVAGAPNTPRDSNEPDVHRSPTLCYPADNHLVHEAVWIWTDPPVSIRQCQPFARSSRLASQAFSPRSR